MTQIEDWIRFLWSNCKATHSSLIWLFLLILASLFVLWLGLALPPSCLGLAALLLVPWSGFSTAVLLSLAHDLRDCDWIHSGCYSKRSFRMQSDFQSSPFPSRIAFLVFNQSIDDKQIELEASSPHWWKEMLHLLMPLLRFASFPTILHSFKDSIAVLKRLIPRKEKRNGGSTVATPRGLHACR
jgi:hypothetical protein